MLKTILLIGNFGLRSKHTDNIFSIMMKRKKLEQEIKIQEAEKRLRELQNKK